MKTKISYSKAAIAHGGFSDQVQYGLVEETDNSKRTIVIFGVPRGGTTMVAGMVKMCGVYLGEDLPINLEDRDFAAKPSREMRNTVESRNLVHDVWGWKFPRAGAYLPNLHEALRNPYYIVVWRDILAAATRGVAKGSRPVDSLARAHQIQAENLSFLKSITSPVLHISYEKAIAAPLEAVDEIQAFIGTKADIDANELLAFTKPGTYKKLPV